MWKVKERMVEKGGSRYFVYLIISPVKIALFLGAMVGTIKNESLHFLQVVIPWYTGAISSPSDLTTHFSASFGTHQFSVIEVGHSYTIMHPSIMQVMSGEANDAPNFVDGFLIRAAYVLSDSTRHPMLLLITQAATSDCTTPPTGLLRLCCLHLCQVCRQGSDPGVQFLATNQVPHPIPASPPA